VLFLDVKLCWSDCRAGYGWTSRACLSSCSWTVQYTSARSSRQIAVALLKGRRGAGGVQEGAVAAGSGRPSMFFSLICSTDVAVGRLGTRE
jgi:hypothetical protein